MHPYHFRRYDLHRGGQQVKWLLYCPRTEVKYALMSRVTAVPLVVKKNVTSVRGQYKSSVKTMCVAPHRAGRPRDDHMSLCMQS